MKPQRDQRKIIKEMLQKRYMKETLCKHFTSINIVERLTVHSLFKSYL